MALLHYLCLLLFLTSTSAFPLTGTWVLNSSTVPQVSALNTTIKFTFTTTISNSTILHTLNVSSCLSYLYMTDAKYLYLDQQPLTCPQPTNKTLSRHLSSVFTFYLQNTTLHLLDPNNTDLFTLTRTHTHPSHTGVWQSVTTQSNFQLTYVNATHMSFCNGNALAQYFIRDTNTNISFLTNNITGCPMQDILSSLSLASHSRLLDSLWLFYNHAFDPILILQSVNEMKQTTTLPYINLTTYLPPFLTKAPIAFTAIPTIMNTFSQWYYNSTQSTKYSKDMLRAIVAETLALLHGPQSMQLDAANCAIASLTGQTFIPLHKLTINRTGTLSRGPINNITVRDMELLPPINNIQVQINHPPYNAKQYFQSTVPQKTNYYNKHKNNIHYNYTSKENLQINNTLDITNNTEQSNQSLVVINDSKKEQPNKQQIPNQKQPNKEQPNKEQPNKEQPNKEQPNKEQPNKEQPNKEQPKQPTKEQLTPPSGPDVVTDVVDETKTSLYNRTQTKDERIRLCVQQNELRGTAKITDIVGMGAYVNMDSTTPTRLSLGAFRAATQPRQPNVKVGPPISLISSNFTSELTAIEGQWSIVTAVGVPLTLFKPQQRITFINNDAIFIGTCKVYYASYATRAHQIAFGPLHHTAINFCGAVEDSHIVNLIFKKSHLYQIQQGKATFYDQKKKITLELVIDKQ